MNQKTLVWGIIVIVVAALAWWYLASSNGAGLYTSDQTATTTDTGTTGSTGTTIGTPATNTFRSIFTQSGNHQCDYSVESTSTMSSDVVYIADGKMHGEFRSTTNGVSTATLMIYSGGYLYSWKEGATTGKRSSIRTLADLPDAIPQDLTSGVILGNASNNVGWNCHYWLKDVKLFTIPTYVTFS